AVVIIVLCILGFFFLFFAGLALGWWLGNLVNNRAIGFLLAAAFFLIILLIVGYLREKKIMPMIRNLIIQKMYDYTHSYIRGSDGRKSETQGIDCRSKKPTE